MSLHLEPMVWTLRVYEEGKSFENKDPYIFVATVVKSGREATISGGLGEFPLSERKKLFKLIKETFGANKVNWIRSNGKEVEYAI